MKLSLEIVQRTV